MVDIDERQERTIIYHIWVPGACLDSFLDGSLDGIIAEGVFAFASAATVDTGV